MLAVSDRMTHVGEPMSDAVELALRLTNHLTRLIELCRGGCCLARARDGIELLELIEPPTHVALPALLGVHRLTRLLHRNTRAFLLLEHRLQARHQGRETLFQPVDLDVVGLHSEQRRYVWMHSASVSSRCR